jgi:hypothetical protein
MSKELGMITETIEALLLKSGMVILGKLEDALDCILEGLSS